MPASGGEDLGTRLHHAEPGSPTRPHPCIPHQGVVGHLARAVARRVDRFWDTVEGRMVPEVVRSPRYRDHQGPLTQYLLADPHLAEEEYHSAATTMSTGPSTSSRTTRERAVSPPTTVGATHHPSPVEPVPAERDLRRRRTGRGRGSAARGRARRPSAAGRTAWAGSVGSPTTTSVHRPDGRVQRLGVAVRGHHDGGWEPAGLPGVGRDGDGGRRDHCSEVAVVRGPDDQRAADVDARPLARPLGRLLHALAGHGRFR